MKKLFVSERFYGIVLISFWMLFLIHKPVRQWIDDFTTPQPWFGVRFDVPDFAAGDESVVVYDRTINRMVYGVWSSNVMRSDHKGGYDYVCGGDGYARYDPETSGTIRMPLSAFIGRSCRYRPGNYRACTSYELKDIHGSERAFGPFCDTFSVLPPSKKTDRLAAPKGEAP